MDDVNLQLVREFFELNVFRVLTNWHQDPRTLRGGERSGQLFVENASRTPARELPVVLGESDISGIEQAVVEVRAWHADRFYPSVIEANPILSQFVSEDSLALARDVFTDLPFTTVLVVSELPVTLEQRNRSVDLLRTAGIAHILEFPVILRTLLNKVSINGSYAASSTLQTLRLLKRYKLVRNQQMEFPVLMEAPEPIPGASTDTTVLLERDEDAG